MCYLGTAFCRYFIQSHCQLTQMCVTLALAGLVCKYTVTAGAFFVAAACACGWHPTARLVFPYEPLLAEKR